VARRALDLITTAAPTRETIRPAAAIGWDVVDGSDPPTAQSLRDLASSESVVYLDDLVERRTNAWCDEGASASVVRLAGEALPRNASREDMMHWAQSVERIGE
jgi:hypothetical protein